MLLEARNGRLEFVAVGQREAHDGQQAITIQGKQCIAAHAGVFQPLGAQQTHDLLHETLELRGLLGTALFGGHLLLRISNHEFDHPAVRGERLVHRRLHLIEEIVRQGLGEGEDIRRVGRYVLENVLGLTRSIGRSSGEQCNQGADYYGDSGKRFHGLRSLALQYNESRRPEAAGQNPSRRRVRQ